MDKIDYKDLPKEELLLVYNTLDEFIKFLNEEASKLEEAENEWSVSKSNWCFKRSIISNAS